MRDWSLSRQVSLFPKFEDCNGARHTIQKLKAVRGDQDGHQTSDGVRIELQIVKKVDTNSQSIFRTNFFSAAGSRVSTPESSKTHSFARSGLVSPMSGGASVAIVPVYCAEMRCGLVPGNQGINLITTTGRSC